MDEETIFWEALEFVHHKKSADWYWILGIVAVSGALISIMLENFLFAVLIVVGSSTLALHASKPPKKVTFSISRRGIQIDKVLHPFTSLDSFWVNEKDEENPKLLCTSKKTLSLQLVIPLTLELKDSVREYMSRYVPEIPQEEPIIERAMELFKF